MSADRPIPIDELVRTRIREVRENFRGPGDALSYRALADRIAAIGSRLDHSQLQRIENGTRLSLTDFLAIAAALGVDPRDLLSPETGAAGPVSGPGGVPSYARRVALTPGNDEHPRLEVYAGSLRLWLAGGWPLRDHDDRLRFFHDHAPADELAGRREEVERRRAAGNGGLPAPLHYATGED